MTKQCDESISPVSLRYLHLFQSLMWIRLTRPGESAFRTEKLWHLMQYIKRRIPVTVTFASTAGELATLEGRIHYEVGDALMTGSAGEHWPIVRAHFEATYDPVAPLRMGDAGAYIKKPISVEARQLDQVETIVLDNKRGDLRGKAGDWIVTGQDKKKWVVDNEIFRATYRILKDNQSN